MCLDGATSFNAGDISSGLQIAGLVTGAFGAASQAQATKDSLDYKAAVERNNAKIAEWQAADAITRGQRNEQAIRLRTAKLASTQRAGFAARGIDIGEGSALNILDDTKYLGEVDALTARDNAKTEAWGYTTQAQNHTNDAAIYSARAGAESPLYSGFTTMLTGAGAVADSWYRRNMKSAT